MPRLTLKRVLIYSAYLSTCLSLLLLFYTQRHPNDREVAVRDKVVAKVKVKWYLRNKANSPVGWADNRIWPEEDAESDRIESQLMLGTSSGEDAQQVKRIYLANGLDSWEVGAGSELFVKQKCPVDNCVLTGKKSDAPSADAILFKDYFMTPRHYRPSQQIWIMYMLECPFHTAGIHERNVFNWTATYRHDSELVTPYEKWVYYDNAVKSVNQNQNYAANKTRKVAWFVSNCAAKNNRLPFARQLQKYIEVDIYGNCGTMSCPRESEELCFELLARHYKFYLSFENSNCRDYITEKFFINGLGNNVLPIVMGAPRRDYERAAPYRSFIHVDDFRTVKELADYLHLLDRDDQLYNDYFQWKGTGEFINTYFFCRLCALLHQSTNHRRRTYEDFDDWWKGSQVCTEGSWRDLNL